MRLLEYKEGGREIPSIGAVVGLLWGCNGAVITCRAWSDNTIGRRGARSFPSLGLWCCHTGAVVGLLWGCNGAVITCRAWSDNTIRIGEARTGSLDPPPSQSPRIRHPAKSQETPPSQSPSIFPTAPHQWVTSLLLTLIFPPAAPCPPVAKNIENRQNSRKFVKICNTANFLPISAQTAEIC